MIESTVHLALAISRDTMAYCCTFLSLWRRVEVREEKTVRKGETLVSTCTHGASLCGWLVCMLVLCIASTNAWSDTDKTILDLEHGRPEAASRYHRPRAAHLYQYDKTDVDLAVPLVQQSPVEQPASQRPGTLPTPTPAPTNTPPQAPLPGGGR